MLHTKRDVLQFCPFEGEIVQSTLTKSQQHIAADGCNFSMKFCKLFNQNSKKSIAHYFSPGTL